MPSNVNVNVSVNVNVKHLNTKCQFPHNVDYVRGTSVSWMKLGKHCCHA